MSPPDGRSSIAQAMDWATRIMTVSMEMVLPGLAGYWLDTKLGTRALFMLIGFVLGSTVAVKHLQGMTRTPDNPSNGKAPVSGSAGSEPFESGSNGIGKKRDRNR